jgi:predicted SnoaL-like aldol condensation-catalyzing enzyme
MPTSPDLHTRKANVETLLKIAFTKGLSASEKRKQMSRYINPDKYIQHSATVPDGFDGLMALVSNFDEQFDDYAVSVKRMIAEGDYVVAHCHYTYGSRGGLGKAIVEIFRFEGDLIVEHWDVIQDVPAVRANTNNMF